MRKMRKNKVFIAVILLFMIILAGCGGKKPPVDSSVAVDEEQAAVIASILDELGIEYRYIKLVTDPDEDPLLYMVKDDTGKWFLLGIDPADGVVTNVLDVKGGRELYRNMEKDVELYGNMPK